jgi:hypothetical protein
MHSNEGKGLYSSFTLGMISVNYSGLMAIYKLSQDDLNVKRRS